MIVEPSQIWWNNGFSGKAVLFFPRLKVKGFLILVLQNF